MATEKSIVISAEVKRGEIINNFAAIKAQVDAKVRPYLGLIFGDNEIRDAKATVAELRKMRSAVEDKRKAIKKQWNEPYEQFEGEVRQITEIIDKPIAEIDSQIKDYEERRKLAKREECEAIVESVVGSIKDQNEHDFVLVCGIVFDERWLNATTAASQVEKDVQAQIDKILSDSRTITEVCEGDELLTELLVEYQICKDLNVVLMKRKRMVEQREAAERLLATRVAEQEAARVASQDEAGMEEPVEKAEIPAAPGTIPKRRIRAGFVLEGTADDLMVALGYVRMSNSVGVTRLYEHVASTGLCYWTDDKGGSERMEA
jgi:hypothetical protein